MKKPKIELDKRDGSLRNLNPTASKIFEDPSSIKGFSDIFLGVISPKMLVGEKVKTPISTKNGEMLTILNAWEEEDKIIVEIPIDENSWLTNLISEEDEIEVESHQSALEQVVEAEDRLRESTEFGANEELLLHFSKVEDFNEFSSEIRDKDNVEIKNTDSMEDKIIVKVNVIPPTRGWL
ncbi:MAG: hypothetical protein BTN85_0738 [Candidatus Methanohalarchaeum thermophilum]|uniref:Uncharacterized protein n=1 Tax=Methanohalarchaeum thermophilum TaxID=1903181 RepID=A0A1Q6DV51_METT1|nr:MAG: hypothetical protein BTN85_0738 [Candidatus Methanohalarchaeum thermophilum]